MTKKLKKALAFLLAASMLTGMLGTAAFAAETEEIAGVTQMVDAGETSGATLPATPAEQENGAEKEELPAAPVAPGDKEAAEEVLEADVTEDSENEETAGKPATNESVDEGDEVSVDDEPVTDESKNQETKPEEPAVPTEEQPGDLADEPAALAEVEEPVAPAVAQVDDTSYTTLQEAINNANGATVTLLQDTTESVEIPDGLEIALDLNGKTLTGKDDNTLTNKGTLTIKDSAFDDANGVESKMGKIVGVDDKIAVVNENGAICTIESGMITRTPYLENQPQNETARNSNYTVQNAGVMYVNGGLIVNNSTYSSLLINYNYGPNKDGLCGTLEGVEMTITGGTMRQDNYIALKNDPNTTMTIAGGEILFDSTNLTLFYGTVRMVSGKIDAGNSTVTVLSYKAPGSGKDFKGTLIIEGGELECKALKFGHWNTPNDPAVNPEIKISGVDTKVTTQEGLQQVGYGLSKDNPEMEGAVNVAISGGTFDRDVSEYCAEGYKAQENADGTWSVVIDESQNVFVAKVGNVGYATLQEAIDAAQGGETVTLIAEEVTGATGKGVITLTKEIALDLNGKKLTNSRFNVEKGSKLIINDSVGTGELAYTDSYGIYLIGGELVVNGGDIHGDGVAIGANHLNSVTEGVKNTCTINGGKLQGASMAIFWNSGALTLNGGELVGATGVEIRSGSLSVPESSTVKVTGTGYEAFGGFAYAEKTGPNIFGAGIAIDTYEDTTVNIAGGEFTGYYGLLGHYTGTKVKGWNDTITVTGGKFIADNTIKQGKHDEKDYGVTFGPVLTDSPRAVFTTTEGTIAISDGVFTTEVPVDYCAENVVPVQTADGYGVEKTLVLSRTTLAMTVGYTTTAPVTLTAETTAAADKIKWSSSNEAVAKVENGVVTAVAAGSATITAEVNGVTATCAVTVNTSYRPSSGNSSGSSSNSGNTTTPVVEELQDEETPLADKPFLFEDVAQDDWFYETVRYVFNRDLMSGISETLFAPYMTTDRGMIVTMLHRLEGEPEEGEAQFPDVAEGQWYTAAVAWSVSADVAKGYENGDFGPEDKVTREQMAVFLFRYAERKGYDVTGRADLSEFADSEDVSDWALEAVQWAVNEGLLKGNGTALVPLGNATRSEAAAVMARFDQIYGETKAE